jgi:predicted nuclease with TOPRIM domain
MVGCTDFSADLREVNDKVDNLADNAAMKTEVAALKTNVENVIAQLETQYATKEEVAAVSATVNALVSAVETAKAELVAALDGKADKATVEAAVAELAGALETAKAEITTVIEGLAAEDTAIKASLAELLASVEALQGNITALQGDVEALQAALAVVEGDVDALEVELAKVAAGVDTLSTELATLSAAFEEYKAKVDAELAKIAAQFEETVATVTAKFEAIEALIANLTDADKNLQDAFAAEAAKLAAQIEAVNTLLAEKVELLLANDEELAAAIADLAAKYDVLVEQDELLAAQDEILAAQDEELAAAIKDLVDAYDELAADVEDQFDAVYDEFDAVYDEVDAIWDEIDAILNDLSNDYEDIYDTLDELIDELNELVARVDVLENELRSIVNVPQVVINGVNSVEFKTLTFVPMGAYDDEVEVVADAETVVVPTYAYFRFNPSSFALANAEYSVVTENVEIRTKAAEESLAIVSVGEENGKVKVELERGAGADNMFALAATLKSNNAVIYSDYVQIVDTKLTAQDVKIVDANNNELYTVLEDAQDNAAAVAIEVGETFSVAEYVKVLGLDMEEFGLEFAYDVVKGHAEIADGVLTAVEAAEATNNIVKVEVVSNGSVVRRAYINVRVIGLVTYLNAEATANLSASRWVYDFANVDDWVKALKDQPNTLELVKSALQSVVSQDYFAAISTLGGIPGLGTETITIEGIGTARVKVDFTAAGYIESQLEKINDIKSVEELAAFIQHIETIYQVSGLKTTVDDALGTVIDYLVPDQYKDNQIYNWVKEQLLNWTVSSLFSFEEDIIADIPLVGVVNVSSWAREKINGVLNSNSGLTQRLQNALVDVVSEIEKAYRENIDANNATAEEIAYNYAKSTALLEAKAAAKTEADNNLKAVNAAEVANLHDGVFGALVKILNTDLCKTKFEENGLAEVYTALQTICGYAETLVQYSAGSCEFAEGAVTEEQVYE